MGDAQKALGALRKNPLYSMAKPGSDQHHEMQDLKELIAQFADERKTYQSMLVTSQTDAGAALRGPGGPVKPGVPLPSDTDTAIGERCAIVENELRTLRTKGDAAGAAAVEREIARLPSAGAQPPAAVRPAAASKIAGATDFSHLWK